MKFMENLISGMLPFSLLIFCGVYITVTGRFFQFAKFLKSIALSIKAFRCKKECKGEISSFQSACTALSATVGTGNIAGVAGAVSLGGAGAIFWMWIAAILGMAIKFAEVKFAVIHRERKNGKYIGGPMFYIKNGLSKKFSFLAFLFAAALIPATFFSGNLTQVNASVSAVNGEKPKILIGILFAVITALVIWGGNRRIGLVTERVVPIMSAVYTALCLGVIIKNANLLPESFMMIFKGAFSPRAVTGGTVGSVFIAMFTGASRGIFSNEAGLGTSAIAHSAAFDANSETQGLFGIVEVFIDTIVICSITALTILCSGVNIEYGKTASSELVVRAISGAYGKTSGYLLGFMMAVFAISSVIGWGFYGNVCCDFIFGKKGVAVFKILYPITCIFGAISSSAFAWETASLFNGIMLIINLPVIMLLWSGEEVKK